MAKMTISKLAEEACREIDSAMEQANEDLDRLDKLIVKEKLSSAYYAACALQNCADTIVERLSLLRRIR